MYLKSSINISSTNSFNYFIDTFYSLDHHIYSYSNRHLVIFLEEVNIENILILKNAIYKEIDFLFEINCHE